jgi:acyl-CoA oxidase
MFRFAVVTLGNEKDHASLVADIKGLKILGCYAQTELGHGSNVAGLETTATLDPKTNEWVFHTPTETAFKFWPGGLGIVANHACVYARCIVGEKDYGPKPFLVQIRDQDGRAFPGVEAGDIGPKMGFASSDNGYLGF